MPAVPDSRNEENPMQAFTTHRGLVAVLDRVDVDTDQIIPKQFLKRIERTGFGEFLFLDWRFREDGTLNPDFELNAPHFKGASILLTGSNFGCGSSREHAPWALLEYGFRSILAPSFADIFFNNCFKNGILAIRLEDTIVRELMDRVAQNPGYELEIDLEGQQIRDDSSLQLDFEIENFRRESLLLGLDEIGQTLQHEEAISRYEERLQKSRT
jgi:3-isopropylmalate/(R)-2-methylmalate dehydratase small subunit